MTRVASIAIASLLAASGADAAIRFERTTHDFGTIPSNLKQTFSWTYRNKGMAPLTIVGMHPSCGCTASVAEPQTVQPGAGGTIVVTFDPAGQSGDVRKTLTVVTADPARSHVVLTIRARVVPVDDRLLPNGHPRFDGVSMFSGACASCHAVPAQAQSGASLWESVCAMCHGKSARTFVGFALSQGDAALTHAIAYGTADPKMPGFSNRTGGPLDDAQIASLIKLVHAHPSAARP